ncbi:hypothetical protein EVG20_g9931, partial [Dentipellis fragilis]
MPVSTTSAAVHITPVVIKTFGKHWKRKVKKIKDGKHPVEKATDDLVFDEAFHIVKSFIQLGTQNTIESLQSFTNTHIPSPFWALVIAVLVPFTSCNRAADLLIEWFGPEDLVKIVGGERWWQVRGLDGVEAEWIAERKFLNIDELDKEKKFKEDKDGILRMEKLESVMAAISGVLSIPIDIKSSAMRESSEAELSQSITAKPPSTPGPVQFTTYSQH